ncbi:hypothetical protein Lesp02_35680 [Lentzea sp. NBRC 105346]|uniref:SCO6745 family protein n=1 Tax=Lentzea sp. NBRC 105346 TaxID=3032205 RepID=UPI0024A12526|nr:hypothetical protein [Lentzea sp. NBRC 105346]GLZ31380.1 hypothetical protein Lesp02_35680 [Lentzea sp. NBRC 105346]
METIARETREALVGLGGRFMTSPQLAAEQERLGLPKGALYFRGRASVLGDVTPDTVATLFGLFPKWLPRMVHVTLPPAQAVSAYLAACWGWAREHLPADERLASLLLKVVDSVDGTALPLFAGWQAAPRPDDAKALLGHALMVARELRGGLHFAALRVSGISVPEAVTADPGGGRPRLLRTGWRPEEVDALYAGIAGREEEIVKRWQEAEQLTDVSFGHALGVLSPEELIDLRDRMLAIEVV